MVLVVVLYVRFFGIGRWSSFGFTWTIVIKGCIIIVGFVHGDI